MKKVLFALLLIFVVVLTLTSCTENDKITGNESNDTSAQIEDNNETKNGEVAEEVEYKIVDSIATENSSGKMSTAQIKLPELASMRRGKGKIVDQSDDTLILMGGQHIETVLSSNEIDKVLHDFFDQPIDVLSKYRRIDYQNYDFSVDSSNKMEINNYSMCKYLGKHTFTFNGVKDERNYVAVVAKLKANDAFVYWIVIDESPEQNQGEKIDEYAMNIAYSLYE